jgi:hypothetical protein
MMVDCLEAGVVTKKSHLISKIKQKATLRKRFKWLTKIPTRHLELPDHRSR